MTNKPLLIKKYKQNCSMLYFGISTIKDIPKPYLNITFCVALFLFSVTVGKPKKLHKTPIQKCEKKNIKIVKKIVKAKVV